MDLLDTNVLVYAVDVASKSHQIARAAVEAAYNAKGNGPGAAHAWLSLTGFLRLSTRTGIVSAPLSVEQALGLVRGLITHPRSTLLVPGPEHMPILARMLMAAGTGGNLCNDAHLAALAYEHNARVVSFDRDFERFSGVRLHLLKAS